MTSGNPNIDIDIQLSNDGYEARLTIESAPDSNEDTVEPLAPEQVQEALHQAGIVFGIHDQAIQEVCANPKLANQVLIASGVPHGLGQDAYLTQHFGEALKATPKKLKNGAVDFKNMGYVHEVARGQVLVTRTPATRGDQGMTVTGQVTPGTEGKDLDIKAGDNCILSEDGNQLTATCNGIVKIENDRITVSEYLEIHGDVGVETGNVSFHGKIAIFGNVLSGYRVDCGDDLIINGLVEAATVVSQGNMVITKGVQGHGSARIECGGTLVTPYIDNGEYVSVEDNLECGELLNTTLFCGGQITLKGKKAQIMGGEVSAVHIEAKTIGSPMGVVTILHLGASMDKFIAYRKLTEEVEAMTLNLDKLATILALLPAKIAQDPTNTKFTTYLDQTKETHKQTKANLIRLKLKLLATQQQLRESTGSLKADVIYMDTLITIGNVSYHVKENMMNKMITKEDEQIVAV